MSRNGNGVYSLPAGNPVVTGTTISSSWANTTLSDIATALTGSVASDGQTTMTGVLNLGSNRISFVADGVDPTDAVNLQQLTEAVIVGGSINDTPIGNITPSTGAFTDLSATGTVSFTGTGAALMPKGTTAQQPASPVDGMIRYNSDTNQFEGYIDGQWQQVGGGATGAGGDQVFVENDQIVTTSYTIPSTKNAMSTGPISIDAGVDVTIPDTSVWVIL